MKKIFTRHLKGPRKSGDGRLCVRMSAKNVQILDQRLKFVSMFLPNIFARKCRPTIDVAHYKYTELRQVLLYTGKVIFKGLMASEDLWHVV